MMDSPEARPVTGVPWLFGRQAIALLAFVAFVAATFLASDLAYLAGALLIVGLGARAWSGLAFVSVRYARRFSRERAFCGDELVLDETIANPRPLPLPWLEVWAHLPAALDPDAPAERSFTDPDRVWVRQGVSLWPYQRLRWRRRIACRRRGVFRLGDVHVRAGDPFGIFERERTIRDNAELLVYPRVVPLRRLALPLHHPAMDVASPRSVVADPTRTATVRDYHPDDPRRLIHWPTTARRGALHVRVLEPATSLHVTLLLDVRGFSFGGYREELLESVLTALASVAVFVQGQGAPVALLANTHSPLVVPPGASVPHLQNVLECLARLNPRSGPPLVPWALEELPRGTSVLLAACEATGDLELSIAHLEDAGSRVMLLLAQLSGRRAPADAIPITPGCDIAARLEGRA